MKNNILSKLKKRSVRLDSPPTHEEIALILKGAQELPHAQDSSDVLTLLLHTGLRVGELRELKWAHIDAETQSVTVWSGKSLHPRQVPIAPEVSQILQKRRGTMSHSEYVLGDHRDRVLRHAMKAMAELSLRYCGRKQGLHSLRQTFAIRLAQGGGDRLSLLKVMGCTSSGSLFKSRMIYRCHAPSSSLSGKKD